MELENLTNEVIEVLKACPKDDTVNLDIRINTKTGKVLNAYIKKVSSKKIK